MAYPGINKDPYNGYYSTSSHTPSYSTSYPQQPYPTSAYPQQQPSTYSYSQQPPSYRTSYTTGHAPSSVAMTHTASNSSFGSSQSGYSRNEYPGSSNPTSPGSDGGYGIDVHYTVASSSKSKGRKQSSPSAKDPPSKGGKPFICLEPGCEFRTAREFDLKRHLKNHFEPAPEDLFPCPGKNCVRVGKEAFKRKDHMMEHVANYHDGYINGKKVVVPKKKKSSGKRE